MRTKKGAFHLGLLLGRGFKNLTLALTRYWELPDNPWGDGTAGVKTESSSQTTWKGTRVSKQSVLFNAGDSRALPLANCQMQTSVRGSCTQCWQRGYRLDVSGSKGTYYFAAPSRLERGKLKDTTLTECRASFANAPVALRDIVLSRFAPALKRHDEVVTIGLAAEQDKRLHSNSAHKCKDGYHRRDAFITGYAGNWDSARQFFSCTSHEVMNIMRNLFEVVGVCGKAAFTGKRKRVEQYLGRLEYIGAEAKERWAGQQATKRATAKAKAAKKKGKRNVGDEGDTTETDDESKARDDAGALSWFDRTRFPFEMSEEDKLVIATMKTTCRMWYDESSSFTLPDDLFANTAHMKIHDWYCLTGCIGAYVVLQSTNMSEKVKQRLIDFLIALEVTTAKELNREHLRAHQSDIINAQAALTPLLPVHVMGTIVNEQIQHFEQQVSA